MLVLPPIATAVAVDVPQRFGGPIQRQGFRHAVQALTPQVAQECMHRAGLRPGWAGDGLVGQPHPAEPVVRSCRPPPELVVRHARTLAPRTFFGSPGRPPKSSMSTYDTGEAIGQRLE